LQLCKQTLTNLFTSLRFLQQHLALGFEICVELLCTLEVSLQ
jgi:hypothetical protein